jgi:carboxymethylenebutenolidase
MKEENIIDLLPEEPRLDRREFFVTSILAAGVFAAAVQPIMAQTKISTDSNWLIVGEVEIPAADGEIPAYRAMPDKKGKFPTVLVI